jgi:hypothetical protein
VIFERLLVDIAGNQKLSVNLPNQLSFSATPVVGSQSTMAYSPIPGMPSNKRQKTNPGSAFAFKFRHDLDRAAAATKPRQFMASQLCTGPRQIQDLFGADFLALMPPGSAPCIKYFIFGNCSAGTTCNMCHSLSSEPTRPVLAGLVKRVKAQVDAFLPKV